MKKKTIYLVASCLIIAALFMASCAPAVTKQEKVVAPPEEEIERAIEDYDEAIRLNPQYADAYYNRGNAYANLGQSQQAIKDFNEAIHLNPEYSNAYYNRGVVYSDLGRKAEAIADFERFVTLTNNPQWIQMARQRIEELKK